MKGQNSQTADNARRTPTWLLDAVRELYGYPDCDPASDWEAQQRIRAATWYGPNSGPDSGGSWRGSDGLAPYASWEGRVWLNPPGGYVEGSRGSNSALWWSALVRSYLSGITSQALFLAFSLNIFRTGQNTPAGVAPYEFPFLVFKDRIRFPGSRPGDKGESPNVDSALVYLLPRVNTDIALAKFALIFGAFGKVRI